jgi:hypothetical protein
MLRDMSLEASDLNVSSFSRAFSSLYKTKQKVRDPQLVLLSRLQYGKKSVIIYKTMESWIKYLHRYRYRTKAFVEIIIRKPDLTLQSRVLSATFGCRQCAKLSTFATGAPFAVLL